MQINSRFELDGHLGTIRFYGALEDKEGLFYGAFGLTKGSSGMLPNVESTRESTKIPKCSPLIYQELDLLSMSSNPRKSILDKAFWKH